MGVPLPSPTARSVVQSNFWGSGRTSLIQDLGNTNFYNCDIDKYPNYGIVTYLNNAIPFTDSNERRILEASLSQCREAYAVSYVRENLVTQDYKLTHKEQWVSPQLVSFHPRWIVVLLTDYPKTNDVPPSNGNSKSAQQESIADEARYKVGFIVEGAKLFNQAISISEVVKDAKRFDHPVHVDYSRSSDRLEYTIIKLFERSQGVSDEPNQLDQ